jgi:hypothetical protein
MKPHFYGMTSFSFCYGKIGHITLDRKYTDFPQFEKPIKILSSIPSILWDGMARNFKHQKNSPKKVSQNSSDYLQHRVRRNPRIYRKIIEITGK